MKGPKARPPPPRRATPLVFSGVDLQMVQEKRQRSRGSIPNSALYHWRRQPSPDSTDADPTAADAMDADATDAGAIDTDARDGGATDTDARDTDAMDAGFYRILRAGKIDDLVSKCPLNQPEACWLGQLTPQGNTPLHIAARKGLHQLIEPILTRRGSLLTQANFNGDLALHMAACEGHLAVVECIVEFARQAENGDDVFEMGNNDGDTCLHLAVRHKRRKVAQYLIDVCPEASYYLNNKSKESPLYVAAELGELRLVKYMIERGDVESGLQKGKSVLLGAISGENLGVLEAILSKPISSENSCQHYACPLASAVAKGDPRMVNRMLQQFPDCIYKGNMIGTFPIHVAAWAGHEMVVEEFLQFCPDSKELLSSSGENILHIAAGQGQDDVVRYILSKPDLDDLTNARDDSGDTPLHHAVAANSPMVVDALTWDTRVKLNLVNNKGQTARDLFLNFQFSLPSLKQELIWMALAYAGAPRKRFIDDERTKKPLNTYSVSFRDYFKDQANTLLVVATLVITITFAVGFTLPGGNRGSEPHLGMANFLKRRIFQLFVISNSVALYTSVLDVIILIFAMVGEIRLLQVSLQLAIPLLGISLAMMSISFMSAAYLAVSALKWLGIVIWVLGSIFLALVLPLFLLLSPPLTAKYRFTQYIVYLPYRVLLYISKVT